MPSIINTKFVDIPILERNLPYVSVTNEKFVDIPVTCKICR